MDFRLFADDLNLRQPLTHASFASLDDDYDDHDKDEAIPIVRLIDNADVKFVDIAVVLAPPLPLPYTGAAVPFLGGECPLSSPNMLSAFESATVPPQTTACRLKRPRCRPCRRNRPRAPNPLGEATPSHPQPMMGGTSTPTTTLTLARANDWAPHLHQPSLQVLQATTAHESAAVTLHRTACRHKRPCCRPGRRNVPRAPNPPDEATPSHPQPMMGGTSTPTTTLTLA